MVVLRFERGTDGSWAQVVAPAREKGPPAGGPAEAPCTHEFETVLGRIGFDEKGAVTGYRTFVWFPLLSTQSKLTE